MLDLDGTIYQTLDLKEGAWHATVANGRSIGIEIANIGAYPPDESTAAGDLVSPGRGGENQDRDPRSAPEQWNSRPGRRASPGSQ